MCVYCKEAGASASACAECDKWIDEGMDAFDDPDYVVYGAQRLDASGIADYRRCRAWGDTAVRALDCARNPIPF